MVLSSFLRLCGTRVVYKFLEHAPKSVPVRKTRGDWSTCLCYVPTHSSGGALTVEGSFEAAAGPRGGVAFAQPAQSKELVSVSLGLPP